MKPLEQALACIEQGIAPLPVAFQGKVPTDPRTGRALNKWGELRLTADAASVFFNGVPQNIGVLLGDASNGLADVDLDCPEAIRIARRFLPPARMFGRASARCAHWLYRVPGVPGAGASMKVDDPNRKDAANRRKGEKATIVEYRANGAQTVIPGAPGAPPCSVHESGEPIVWENDAPIPTVDRDELVNAVQRIGAAVLLARYMPPAPWQGPTVHALAGALLARGDDPDDVWTFAVAVLELSAPQVEIDLDDARTTRGLEEVAELYATDDARRRALNVALAALGLSVPTYSTTSTATPEDEPPALAAVDLRTREEWAARYLGGCTPEHSSDGSSQLVKLCAYAVRGFALGKERGHVVVWQHFVQKHGLKWSQFAVYKRASDAMAGPRGGTPMPWGCKVLERVERQVADETSTESSTRSRFDRADHVEMASALVEDLGGADALVFAELHLWKHDAETGVWTPVDHARKSRVVQGYAGELLGTSTETLKIKASDVTGAIKLAHDQVARPTFFADAPAGLVFTNGFVRVTAAGDLELAPHSAEHRARAAYPFAFERGALPRRLLIFLHELFRDDADRTDKTSLVQEFFGACVLGLAPRYQRALLAYGHEADNGKSTLAEVMIESMPRGTTSAIAPQEWGNDYKRAMLVGKHLNAVGELPEREIIASEAFKAIVTGDPIVGREIRESPVMFRPKAGHYFAANRLPGTADQSEGFWRRFLVLTFNRSFKGDPARDPQMAEKVLAERPQIVSWLVDGAAQLVRKKAYTIPASHDAALAAWRKSADQVALFVESETRTVGTGERGTPGARLYEAYRRWAELNGHRALASNKFAERMQGRGLAATKSNGVMHYPVALLTIAERAAGEGPGRVQGGSPPSNSAGVFDA